MYSVGLIGVGNMGEAMLGGWLEEKILEKEAVLVCEAEDDRRRYLEDKYSVAIESSVGKTASQVSYCFLAIKPQDSNQVLLEISNLDKKPDVLISVVAGLTRATIKKNVGENISVVRVMPNMAARVRCAISAYSFDSTDDKVEEEMIEELLGGIGETVRVEESLMNLVTAVSGSGPAYFFYMVEALERAAVEQGLPADLANKLAEETFYGSAMVMKKTGVSAGELRKAVSSPGGTTVAGLKQFEEREFYDTVNAAVNAAKNRAGELVG